MCSTAKMPQQLSNRLLSCGCLFLAGNTRLGLDDERIRGDSHIKGHTLHKMMLQA